MYHSINFEIDGKTYNTWDDWRLIPYPRPSVALPKVRTKFLDIPGMDGQLDITTILTGKPNFDNRTGSWELYLSRRRTDRKTIITWSGLWRKVADVLHGATGKVWLEDDPAYLYEGRFSLGPDFKTNKDYSQLKIEYTLKPKAERNPRAEWENGAWLWDPFDFETDVVDMDASPRTLVERTYVK